MSKIEELIEKYCPEGVEYKTIKKLAEVGTGSSNGNESEENGLYPFFVRSQIIKRKNTYEFDEEAIIIPGEGGIGDIFHYVNGKYALHQRVYRIHFLTKIVNVRFAYYYMFAYFKPFILKKAVSATVTSIRKPMIEDFTIPVPPLPVQEEIVRILDKFTSLEAELEAELEARRKQYEYYRDKLLSFNEIGGGVARQVRWMKMSEIGYFYGGLTGKSKSDFGNGNAKFITYMNVFSNVAINLNCNDTVKINQGEKQNRIELGDIIFTGSSETPEESGMSSVMTNTTNTDYYLNSFCFGFRLDDKSLLLPDFSKHLFRSKEMRKQIVLCASGVTRFNISKKRMEKIIVPIPTIEYQQYVATILDKFDALVNDISTGLPAEIEARRKQYEYYRNKLLTF